MIVIGIDIGTTGTKALAVNESGAIIGGGYYEYPLISFSDGIVEQDALEWISGIIHSVTAAIYNIENKNEIAAISLSTQGASMTAVDAEGNPLCNALTWMDSRASLEASFISDSAGADYIYRTCGWNIEAYSDSAKILWLIKNRPEITRDTHCFVSTLEFANYFLCGKYISDPTNSAIRGMYDINNLMWDKNICDAAGIDISKLPQVLNTGEFIGTLSKKAAQLLGLSDKVKIYNGAHDQYCAALGCGALSAGDMLISTGTTWVIFGVTDKAVYSESHISPGIHPASCIDKPLFGAMASITSAGSALRWYKNIVGVQSYSVFDDFCSSRIENSKNLYFMPYIAGAGFPNKNPDAGGCCFGMKLHHDKFDIALALMEGVAFEAKNALLEYSEQGIDIKNIKITGGAAKSDLWCSLVGYITGCNIFRMSETEGCAIGAAMIAGVGCNMFENYSEAAGLLVSGDKIICDDDELFDFYKKKHEKYNRFANNIKLL